MPYNVYFIYSNRFEKSPSDFKGKNIHKGSFPNIHHSASAQKESTRSHSTIIPLFSELYSRITVTRRRQNASYSILRLSPAGVETPTDVIRRQLRNKMHFYQQQLELEQGACDVWAASFCRPLKPHMGSSATIIKGCFLDPFAGPSVEISTCPPAASERK